MNDYLLRAVPPSLWKRVQGRLRAESKTTRQPVTIRALILRLLRDYAR